MLFQNLLSNGLSKSINLIFKNLIKFSISGILNRIKCQKFDALIKSFSRNRNKFVALTFLSRIPKQVQDDIT